MPPPSPSPERAKVAKFYYARSKTIPPLPWQTFALPFSQAEPSKSTTLSRKINGKGVVHGELYRGQQGRETKGGLNIMISLPKYPEVLDHQNRDHKPLSDPPQSLERSASCRIEAA